MAEASPRGNTIRRTLLLLRGQRGAVALLLALLAVSVALDIAVPIIAQRLIDRLISFFKDGGAVPAAALAMATGGILAATVLNRSAKSLYDYKLFRTVTAAEDRLRLAAFERYLRLHSLFHHHSSSGQIIGRIERGATSVYAILHDIFGQNLLPPLVVSLGVLAVLLWLSPAIALLVALPVPLYLLLTRRLTQRIYEIEKQVNEEFEEVAKQAYDVAGNVLTVKKFGQEGAEAATEQALLRQARDTQYRAEKLWAYIENVQTAIAAASRVAVILYAGFAVFRAAATVGQFVLFLSLQQMLYAPIASLSVVFPRLRRNIARLERLYGIIDEPVHVLDAPDALALPPLAKEIRFEQVSFRYADGGPSVLRPTSAPTSVQVSADSEAAAGFGARPSKDLTKDGPWVLRGIDVTIPAGARVALVGRSGSGKTTFINLLLRSYDSQEGRITFDGHDLRAVTQESLRAQIAVVPQEVDLFSRTVAENIAYGRPQASAEEIAAAARTALAHEFISALPEGYQTVVGERGIKLSGGERQRVGIARAVLRDPRLLILDEATSHLDSESERLVQAATERLAHGRTTIIIAHRLSTVLSADTILVFNQGRIEASGPHRELLGKSETYRRLYEMQFASTL